MGEVRAGYNIGWYPDFANRNLMRLVVLFTAKRLLSGNNAVNLFDGGKESTFGNLSAMAMYM
jgi:hypothetical protein